MKIKIHKTKNYDDLLGNLHGDDIKTLKQDVDILKHALLSDGCGSDGIRVAAATVTNMSAAPKIIALGPFVNKVRVDGIHPETGQRKASKITEANIWGLTPPGVEYFICSLEDIETL
jgi:hypothetical protein